MSRSDKKALPRFHGSFTGGFSAGHFNTVGSEEGFKPKTFTSSRSNRNVKISNRVTDYMDIEDGLLGGHLSTQNVYDTFDDRGIKVQKNIADVVSSGNLIPGPVPRELLPNLSQSIGKKMLSKMGWKEGHSIGSMRTYDLPAEVNMPISSSSGVTIKEKTVAVPQREIQSLPLPKLKTDVYGIGFDIAKHSLTGRSYSEQSTTADTAKRKRTIQEVLGQSSKPSLQSYSTLNVYHDDDEDNVYDSVINDSSARKSSQMYVSEVSPDDDEEVGPTSSGTTLGNIHSSVDSWLAQSKLQAAISVCPTDGKPIISGFVLAAKSQTQLPPDEFPALIVPTGYRPPSNPLQRLRERLAVSEATPGVGGDAAGNQAKLSRRMQRRSFLGGQAQARGELLGESGLSKAGEVEKTLAVNKLQQMSRSHIGVSDQSEIEGPAISSVFNLLSSKSLQKLQSATGVKPLEPMSKPTPEPTPHTSIPPEEPEKAPAARPYLAEESVLKTTFAGLSAAFKNRFVTASQGTATQPADQLSNALVGLKTASELAEIKSTLAEDNLAQAPTVTAVKMRKPRYTSLWFPHPLLCKRFNIPVPDASSTVNLPPSSSSSQPYPTTATSVAQVPSGQAVGGADSNGREQELFHQSVGKYMTSSVEPTATLSAAGSLTKPTVAAPPAAVVVEEDIYLKNPPRAPQSLFQSIFADDSSDDESESEGDESEAGEGASKEEAILHPKSLVDDEVAVPEPPVAAPQKILFKKPANRPTKATSASLTTTTANTATDTSEGGATVKPIKAVIRKPLLSFEDDNEPSIIIKKTKVGHNSDHHPLPLALPSIDDVTDSDVRSFLQRLSSTTAAQKQPSTTTHSAAGQSSSKVRALPDGDGNAADDTDSSASERLRISKRPSLTSHTAGFAPTVALLSRSLLSDTGASDSDNEGDESRGGDNRGKKSKKERKEGKKKDKKHSSNKHSKHKKQKSDK